MINICARNSRIHSPSVWIGKDERGREVSIKQNRGREEGKIKELNACLPLPAAHLQLMLRLPSPVYYIRIRFCGQEVVEQRANQWVLPVIGRADRNDAGRFLA